MTKVLLLANTSWYLFNYRLPLVRGLQRAGMTVVLASPPDRYTAELQRAGCEWRPLRLSRRGLNPLGELAALPGWLRLYRAERPDLVHHFTVKPVVYGTWAARLTGVPAVVNSITGLGYTFLSNEARGRLLRPIVRSLYRSALNSRGSWTIFQNPDDRNRFIGLRLVPPQRSCLIPGSGVDLERFHPTPEPEGPPAVLLAARMLWDKGIGELVEAVRRVRQSGVDLRLRLVGDPDPGNPASIPPAQLEAWASSGQADWLGHRDDMPDQYAAAHIVTLPTYGEGLPRSLVEAGACGRAVIASDVPGCREVVQDGVNGLLVPARDPGALAGSLAMLCTEPELRRSLGRRGRAIVEQRFSDATIVAATLELYRNALAGKPGLPAEG